MKKKNEKNHIRKRFSTILLCILAILLCAAPALKAADETVPAGETWDIDYEVKGILWVNGKANLRTGASAQYIYVQDGGTLNMYSGTKGGLIYVSTEAAGMTVYGTDFAVSNSTIEPDGNWTPDLFGTLTGYYEDGSQIKLVILSDIPIHLKALDDLDDEVEIDIKPGNDLNSINLNSRGVVRVAVLTTDVFDASDVDPTSVVFAGASPVRWRLCDVDDDDDLDMLFHFNTHELNLDEKSTEAMLTCSVKDEGVAKTTNEEVRIQGTDTVRILPQKKK